MVKIMNKLIMFLNVSSKIYIIGKNDSWLTESTIFLEVKIYQISEILINVLCVQLRTILIRKIPLTITKSILQFFFYKFSVLNLATS